MDRQRLAPGSRLLCTVLAVHPLALVLSLPNQLVGHVPITQISSLLTERLETAANASDGSDGSDDSSSEEEEEDDSDNRDAAPIRIGRIARRAIPELRQMFVAGQMVIASVVRVHSPGSRQMERLGGPGREGGEYERESRRVVLSLDPEVIHRGVSAHDLQKGGLMPCTIKRREDHGWTVETGLEDVKAFVPFTNTPPVGAKGERAQYAVGQVVLATVEHVQTRGDAAGSQDVTLRLSLLPPPLASSVAVQKHAPSITALVPGMPVQALITSCGPSGLSVKLWGLFDATIDRAHLPLAARTLEFSDTPTQNISAASAKANKENARAIAPYHPGQHIRARILWDVAPSVNNLTQRRATGEASFGDEDSNDDRDDGGLGLQNGLDDGDQQRKIGISAAEHVLGLAPPVNLAAVMPLGTTVEATVTGADADWGLSVSVKLPESSDTSYGPFAGFVHISRVSDERLERLTTSGGTYKVGSVHTSRVVGHALTDGLVLLSMQESILQRAFMRVSEVQVGEVLRATIKEVNGAAGIFLDLGGSVDGIVFPLHYSDIILKKPEKKYKPGTKVNARVLLVEPARNRIALTLKKTLVQSDLPIVASIQDARVGIVTHATVSRILPASKGMLVDLFGGVRAFVPVSEASESYLEDLSTLFYEGKPVKIRITAVDYTTSRLTASVRQAQPSFQARLNVDAVALGDAVEATVAAVHQDVVVLSLVPSDVRALLSLSILAKHRSTSTDALRDALQEGELLKELTVVSKNQEKGIVIVGLKGAKPLTTDGEATNQVQLGTLIDARVIRESEPCAVTVLLPGKARGRLHLLDVADEDDEAKLPAMESIVRCVVLGGRHSRFDVSTRPSLLAAVERGESPKKDSTADKASDLIVGSRVTGFVKSVADAGLFVDVGRSVTARVKISQLFDGFVKEWKGKFHVGQRVVGTVLEVNAKKNQAELSLKTAAVAPQQTKADKVANASSTNSLTLEQIEKGQKINGFVRGISEYGVFVQIEDTAISGLCHKSQVSLASVIKLITVLTLCLIGQLADNAPDDALKAFSIGDRVKALVLDVNAEKKKISFGLKPSYFSADDFGDRTPGQEDDEEMLNASDDEEAAKDDDEEDHDQQEADNDDEDADQSDEVMNSSDSDDFVNISTTRSNKPKAANGSETAAAPKLELAGGFSWSGGVHDGSDDDADNDSDDSDSDDDGAVRKETKQTKNGKNKRRNVTEDDDLTATLATQAPQSSTDFERILLGSPNSSFVWIQFMSFHLQLADVERAREVARRALRVIGFREEQERLNVWIALLNLENSYGSEEQLQKVFREAAQANDAKTVHLRLLQILERSGPGKAQQLEDLWKKTVKKFGGSSKVWVLYDQFLLRQGRPEEARLLLARCMQSLEKRKRKYHLPRGGSVRTLTLPVSTDVKTITAFALAEYRVGDAERGRTIFEGLLDTYPKRLDIWLQYIDQEAKALRPSSNAQGNLAMVRALFDRVLALRQSTKKGKSILKKWLEFEKRYGTPEGQQAVLLRAKEFVAMAQRRAARDDAAADTDDDVEEDGEEE